MQTIELPLFTLPKSTPETKKIQHIQSPRDTPNPLTSFDNILNSIFPDQTEENKIARTRKHLGVIGRKLSDEQVECITSEFQFLIDSWLDEYEKEVFGGLTLKEVINEK